MLAAQIEESSTSNDSIQPSFAQRHRHDTVRREAINNQNLHRSGFFLNNAAAADSLGDPSSEAAGRAKELLEAFESATRVSVIVD